jgi:lipopolysaccharide transport system permease protein
MHELIIEPGARGKAYWRDLWRYRELFTTLAWRDISVRYRQTVVGAAWALLQPLLTMIIMTILFGRVAQLSSEAGAPYALMVIAGMLPWQFFSSALTAAAGSLVANSSLISKIYFPRMIIPAASVVTSFVDFLVSFVILVGMLVWFQHLPDWRILTLPLFAAMAFAVATGLGLFFAALNVKYRDFRYIVTFVVQFGLYISPVGYSSSLVKERFGDTAFSLYCLNPMVGVIDGFRWAVLGGNTELNWIGLVSSLGTVVLAASLGVWYFRRTESRFADII